MELSEIIPDHEERAEFVRRFMSAAAKAVHDIRAEGSNLDEDQTADELERRIRLEIGNDFPLPRPQLLQLAKGVVEDPITVRTDNRKPQDVHTELLTSQDGELNF